MTFRQKAIVTHKLKLLCEEIRQKYFPNLPSIGILVHFRSKKHLAGFHSAENRVEPIISVSEKHYQRATQTEIKRTILHEMIHYKLFHEGKRRGHTDEFKKIAWELGLRSSSEHNWRWIYNCDTCRRKYKTIRHWSKYKCLWCRKILEARPTRWWKRFEKEHKITPAFLRLK